MPFSQSLGFWQPVRLLSSPPRDALGGPSPKSQQVLLPSTCAPVAPISAAKSITAIPAAIPPSASRDTSPKTSQAARETCACTYLARLGLILSRVPFLGLLGRVRDRPGRLAKGLRLGSCRGRHCVDFGWVVRLVQNRRQLTDCCSRF